MELRTGRHHGSVPPPGDVPSGSDFTEANRRTYDRIARRYADHQARLPPDAGHWLTGLEDRFVAGLSGGAVVADLGASLPTTVDTSPRSCRYWGSISRWECSTSPGSTSVAASSRPICGPSPSPPTDSTGSGASPRCCMCRNTTPPRSSPSSRGSWRRPDRRARHRPGRRLRHEAVPYAAEESRWFVYRDPVTLKGQMEDVGLVIQHAEEIEREQEVVDRPGVVRLRWRRRTVGPVAHAVPRGRRVRPTTSAEWPVRRGRRLRIAGHTDIESVVDAREVVVQDRGEPV